MTSLARKIAEGTALISLANIITGIFGLLSFIVIVRILGRFEYGLIVLASSAISIAGTLLDPGIGGVITADASRERGAKRYDKVKSLLYHYSQVEIFSGFFLFVIIFLSNTYFEQRYSEIVSELVKISAFLIITTAGKNIFLTTFNSHLDFKSIFSLNVGESFFKLIYVILFGYHLELGLYGVMLAYPLSSFTSLLLIFPNYLRIIKGYFSISRPKENFFLKTVTSHGKWAIGIRPLKKLTDNIQPWLIQFFLGVEAVAIFNVARKAVRYTIFLFSPLENVLMPVISKEIKNIERINKIINKSIKYSIWFSLPIITLSIILSPFAFNIFFGSSYSESARIFQILIFISLVYALNLTMRPLFFGLRAQKYLFIIYAISTMTFLLLGIILILLGGLYGFALAFIINGLIGFLLRYKYIRREGIRIIFKEILEIDDYDRELMKKIKKEIKSIIIKISL
jgi:O-antigen/teichoic acid export membrane protein